MGSDITWDINGISRSGVLGDGMSSGNLDDIHGISDVVSEIGMYMETKML